MKNIVKILGIIAIVAMVGLTLSCETDPEDQTVITITGFGALEEGQYGYIILSSVKNPAADDYVAYAAAAKPIGGGSLRNEMNNTKGEAYGKDDSLFIIIGVGSDALTAQSIANVANGTYISDSKKAVTKSDCSFDLSEFTKQY